MQTQNDFSLLIVEDDPDLGELLLYNLNQAGFSAKLLANGQDAYWWLKEHTPDLLVLDLMLPGMDGLDICRRLRREGKKTLPIIMLTARAEEMDKVVGLELGADDYVTKPFSMRELILRIKAVLRRKGEPEADSHSLRFSQLYIDVAAHAVTWQGRPLALTNTEFALLLFLAQRAGRVQSREGLLQAVWNYHNADYARTVDTHMRRLRQKLGPAAMHLQTVRGVGYRFSANP